MSNELTIYERIQDPMAAVAALGEDIARSQMFGCDNVQQGRVFALECLARRLPPLSLAEQYHIVDGKLMMRYDSMLAEFNRRGGKHRILSRTPEKAEIELEHEGETYRESYTWEEAQADGLPFGKEGKDGKHRLKKNWSTLRGRKQMLWARVVSEAVRAVMPGVNHGRYTPEEMSYGPATSNGKTEPAIKPDGEIIDAEYTVVDDNDQQNDTAEQQDGFCTAEQSQQIKLLFGKLNLTPEQRAEVLAKRNATACRNLSGDQAAELIASLERKLAAVTEKLAGTSVETQGVQSAGTDEPAAQALVDEIKGILKSCQDPELVQRVRDHLGQHGKANLSQLTQHDAERLKVALLNKEMEAFFDRQLSPVPQ